MKYVIWVFFLICSQAAAQTAVVRSGEHEGFTRVVVAIDFDTKWEIDKEKDHVDIRFSQSDLEFDTVRAFDRITTNRVTNIDGKEGFLRITLGCTCRIEVTESGKNLIVVDVSGDLTNVPNEAEEFLEIPQEFGPPQKPSEISPLDVRNFPITKQAKRSMPILHIDEAPTTSIVLNYPELQNRLSQQFSAALTQGLIDPNRDFPKPVSNVPAQFRSIVQNNEGRDIESALISNLRTNGALAIEVDAEDAINGTLDGMNCDISIHYDVNQWNINQNYSESTSYLRRNLYGEFDMLNEGVALQLSRTLLYFGFGAEAISVSNLLRDGAERTAVRQMAQIIEYGHTVGEKNLEKFTECGNQIAMWALLSSEEEETPLDFDKDVAIRAVKALPEYLRSILGPKLSKKLRIRGDGESAALVMRDHARLLGDKPIAGKLETAEVKLKLGKVSEANLELTEVMQVNSLESPIALVKYIDLQVHNGEDISNETAILAEAFAFEHRESEIGPEIRRAHVIALAKSSQFDEAFSLYFKSVSEFDDQYIILDQLYSILSTEAEDVVFLKYGLSNTSSMLEILSENSKLQISDRLISLGFVHEASTLLEGISNRTRPEQQKLLRAKVYNGQGRYSEVIDILKDEDGEEERKQRAIAQFYSGNFSAAAVEFQSIGDEFMLAESNWRDESGANISGSLSDFVQRYRRLREFAAPEVERGSLKGAEELLIRSVQLSESVSSLLEALPTPGR
ncbi:MAG: hypothetical protein ABJL99_03000 [Aliishimia sp.]